MLRAVRWACLTIGALALARPAAAAPFIIGNAGDPRCIAALDMAAQAFRSTSFDMSWPIREAADRVMRIVVQQSDADTSGGRTITTDPAHFDTIKRTLRDDYAVDIEWGKRQPSGKRLAVVAWPHGWQGDMYTVHLLPSGTTIDDFAGQLTASMARTDTPIDPLLGDNRWTPPLIILDGRSDSYWLVDVGEPYDILPDWKVIVLSGGKATTPCRIGFGYSKTSGLAAMPIAVRQLAAALYEALGPGENEGTLQPTARTRLAVERGWANADLRPWALAEPYNTRAEVDHGLVNWAKANPKRAALLRRIKLLYPEAELALTHHYASRPDQQASAPSLGRQMLDNMFRSYFTFSKSSPPDQ